MDTNLKSNRKIRKIVTVLLLCVFAAGMVWNYRGDDLVTKNTIKSDIEECLSTMDYSLAVGNQLVYQEVSGSMDASEEKDKYTDSDFSLLKKYMDYQIFDKDGKPLLEGRDDQINESLESQSQADSDYGMKIEYTYGMDGEVSNVTVSGSELTPEEAYHVEMGMIAYGDYADLSDQIENEDQTNGLRIVYGMTKSDFEAYVSENQYTEEYTEYNRGIFWHSGVWFFAGILLAALILPRIAKIGQYEGRRFRIPFEPAVLVGIVLVAVSYELQAPLMYWSLEKYSPFGSVMWNTWSSFGINFVIWFCVFGLFFCAVESLRLIFTCGKSYWTEHTLTGMAVTWVKANQEEVHEKRHLLKKAWRDIKGLVHRQYEAILQMDLKEKGTKGILRIVILNFLLLLVVKLFSDSIGLVALIVYSVILFFIMRKVLNGLKKKYQLLLKSTNQLANGQLDLPIEGDVGIFRPIQEELRKIQSGFKKAVEEEVKNERMKTELVTNVSHDLRTPLTAIITYIDLLKNETDEEKRKEYTEILERKSLRLKVLIEDLFEMSKAASKTVQMNYMKVDLVGLIRQAELENEEKIKEANLEFRWKLPDKKLILWLDSEKTYRIFENLIVNITKYAMPHTRVYVEVNEHPDEVQIYMKNVSAGELNFNTDEITDRFVRGDSSRNTGGSGLGLAIAKSFAELQHGSLRISTEADLFKAEIILPKLNQPEKEEQEMM